MRKILGVLLILVILFSMVGCGVLVSTQYETVDVKIVDSYYRGPWVQPIIIGKVISNIVHPAQYRIDVEYNNVKYSFHTSDVYHKYKDKIGNVVSGTLEKRTYDDGTVKYDITALG